MSELDGFQVVITGRVGPGQAEFTLDNVTKAGAGELIRQWHRPRWFRRGVGVTARDRAGQEVFVYWADMLDLRVQPQAEVYP